MNAEQRIDRGIRFVSGALLAVPIFFFGIGLVEYGTVAPCEMAAKEATRQAIAVADTSDGDWGFLGRSAAIDFLERETRARFSQFGAMRCVRIWWHLKADGLDSLDYPPNR